ncbi:MAG: response regulator transcription factor [Leadbetterella sp.]
MSSKKILIIEDELRIAQNISKGLQEKGFVTETAFDGMIGLKMALSNDFDLILLDLNLPSMNGYEVCEKIRKQKAEIPIIMLTALGETEDKIEGFEKGADDYLVKPFDFRELLARINVFFKGKTDDPAPSSDLQIANLILNMNTKTAYRDSKPIELTPKEFSLLAFLFRNKDKIVSKSDISEGLWGQKNQQSLNLVEVYINFLRKKVDKDFEPKLIHTKSGMGYIMRVEDLNH